MPRSPESLDINHYYQERKQVLTTATKIGEIANRRKVEVDIFLQEQHAH